MITLPRINQTIEETMSIKRLLYLFNSIPPNNCFVKKGKWLFSGILFCLFLIPPSAVGAERCATGRFYALFEDVGEISLLPTQNPKPTSAPSELKANDSFWVIRPEGGYRQIEAVLKHQGTHSCLYLASSLNSHPLLETLVDEFDRLIYPTLTSVFGSEPNPGIDLDPRIKILILPLGTDGPLGYFSPVDGFSRLATKYLFPEERTNEAEIIYLNSTLLEHKQLALATLAHEFQHMIHFHQKLRLLGLREDIWLDEACSEYAEDLCGYSRPYRGSPLEERVKAFLAYPDDSLTDWQGRESDYASVRLFMHYFVEHYGGDRMLKTLLSCPKTGSEALEYGLACQGQSKDLSSIFTDWITANYVNNPGLGLPYAYLHPDLAESVHLFPDESVAHYPYQVEDHLSAWSYRGIEFKSQGSVALRLTCQAGQGVEFTLASEEKIDHLSPDSSGYGRQTISLPKDGYFIIIPTYSDSQEGLEGSFSLYLDIIAQTPTPGVPDHLSLLQNYPNPVNPETWIPFKLDRESEVSVRIYTLTGELIKAINLGHLPPGDYTSRKKAAYWNGTDETGSEVASGVYFYQLETGSTTLTRRMVISK
ncbi:MAG: T9SS type A sorting domain-containing protein [bacterium]